MNTISTRSLSEFLQYADVWDYLWSTSDVTNPLCLAENLVAAVRHFHNEDEFQVTFIFDDGDEPVAALPLIKRRLRGLFPVLELPNNEWGCWGELLINRRRASQEVYEALASAIQDDRHAYVRFPLIEADSANWARLLQSFQTCGKYVRSTKAFSVGIVEHDHSWRDFQERLSKGFRKKLKKYKRQLNALGTVSCEILTSFKGNDVARVMDRLFDVEARSWKSAERTTLRAQGKLEFFAEQAGLLAKQNMLCVSFLRIDDQDIAFEFGFLAKRTYHSLKIGFDTRFHESAPGQLLAEFLAERFHVEHLCDVQDTVGPISQATARWSTRVKPAQNTVVSGNIPGARIGLLAMRWLKQLMQVEQQKSEPEPAMKQKRRTSIEPPRQLASDS